MSHVTIGDLTELGRDPTIKKVLPAVPTLPIITVDCLYNDVHPVPTR